MFIFFKAVGKYFFGFIQTFMTQGFTAFSDIGTISTTDAHIYITEVIFKSLLLSLPFLLVAAVVAIAFNMAQTRLNFSFNLLNKLNPIEGMKKLLSGRSFVELLKSIIKVAIVGAVIYSEIKANIPQYSQLIDKSIYDSLLWIAQMIYTMAIKAGIFLLAFGVADYLYQWWDYERQIRMSHQDIKDEYKQTEGDPQIKSRQKERQRRMAMLRMAQKVPHADVIVRNPTHFAVAIKYDREKDKAPRVIAKGQDYLALKIIEIAETNKITISTDPPLARGLYASVDLDQEIPEKYYQAIAEILVFVYSKVGNKK